jgi:hypothetical protein
MVEETVNFLVLRLQRLELSTLEVEVEVPTTEQLLLVAQVLLFYRTYHRLHRQPTETSTSPQALELLHGLLQ